MSKQEQMMAKISENLNFVSNIVMEMDQDTKDIF